MALSPSADLAILGNRDDNPSPYKRRLYLLTGLADTVELLDTFLYKYAVSPRRNRALQIRALHQDDDI